MGVLLDKTLSYDICEEHFESCIAHYFESCETLENQRNILYVFGVSCWERNLRWLEDRSDGLTKWPLNV